MNPDIYNEYIQMHKKICCLTFTNIDWNEFKALCQKLSKEPIYALCLNTLYIGSANSYINYLVYNNTLQGCPCNMAKYVITSYDVPSYITPASLNLLIFKDFLNGRYCTCNDFYCEFKPPYPKEVFNQII